MSLEKTKEPEQKMGQTKIPDKGSDQEASEGPERENKKCVECSRVLPLSEYKRFSGSGRYTSMCNRCRTVKSRYMRHRRTTLMRKEMKDHGKDVDDNGRKILLAFDEEIRVRKETDQRYSDLEQFFDYLEKSALDDGKVITAKFEHTMPEMPMLSDRDEGEVEVLREAIAESKQHMKNSIAERLSGKNGYKWGVYRVSASERSVYMTLYCSEDRTRARASTSTGKRIKMSKKTVDCRSQVHASYNCSTQLLKISYTHINHTCDDTAPAQVLPVKRRKKSTPQDSGIEVEEVDPTITAIHAQVQAQQQQFLKKILN